MTAVMKMHWAVKEAQKNAAVAKLPMPVEDWLLRNWRVPAGVEKSADRVARHLRGQILQETGGTGDLSLKVGPSGSVGGGAPSYPSYQVLPLAMTRGTAPPVREFIHTGAPLLPQELWLSFVGEKGEVLPGDPKFHMDTSTDIHFYIEEIRAGGATVWYQSQKGYNPFTGVQGGHLVHHHGHVCATCSWP